MIGSARTEDLAQDRSGYGIPLLLAVLSLLITTSLSLRPSDNGLIGVLFPPWWSSVDTMNAASAAGDIIRFGALRSMVVIAPTTAHPEQALRQAGAWLLFDPLAAGGCDPTGYSKKASDR